jgi:hypothetical protein
MGWTSDRRVVECKTPQYPAITQGESLHFQGETVVLEEID